MLTNKKIYPSVRELGIMSIFACSLIIATIAFGIYMKHEQGSVFWDVSIAMFGISIIGCIIFTFCLCRECYTTIIQDKDAEQKGYQKITTEEEV